jgi:hypothetical protein
MYLVYAKWACTHIVKGALEYLSQNHLRGTYRFKSKKEEEEERKLIGHLPFFPRPLPLHQKDAYDICFLIRSIQVTVPTLLQIFTDHSR